MNMCHKFTVYGDPTAKARARVTQHRTYTPQKTKDYEANVGWSFRKAYPGFIPSCLPVSMCVDMFYPMPSSKSGKWREKALSGEIKPISKRNDMDNVLKSIWDGLNKLAYADDCQVVECVCRKLYAEVPRVEVEIIYLIGCDKK